MVTWIYDGDTVVVETDEGEFDVRLIGINAPDKGECFYSESLNYLVDRLKGRRVTLDEATEPDQYGRALAHIWDGDRQINLELVNMGLAIATTPDSGGGFLVQEDEAFTSGVGLWAAEACGSGPIPDVRIVAVDSSNEMIVIASRASRTIDLSGWTIRDESSRHRFRFPVGANIHQGAELTIGSDDSGWDPGGSAVWNNGGDMALLLDDSGRVIGRLRY